MNVIAIGGIKCQNGVLLKEQDGHKYIDMTVCCHDYPNNDNFINCIYWVSDDDKAQQIYQGLLQSTSINAVGKLKTQFFTDKYGQKLEKDYVLVNDLTFYSRYCPQNVQDNSGEANANETYFYQFHG